MQTGTIINNLKTARKDFPKKDQLQQALKGGKDTVVPTDPKDIYAWTKAIGNLQGDADKISKDLKDLAGEMGADTGNASGGGGQRQLDPF